MLSITLLPLGLSKQSIPFSIQAILSSFTGSPVLGTFGIHLLLEETLTLSLGFGSLDLFFALLALTVPSTLDGMANSYMFNKSTLVLESVTLAQMIEFMVEVLVNLSRGTITSKQTTENTHPTHPKDLTNPRTLAL